MSQPDRNADEPRWVATGPLLPAGMFVATFIAALNYPTSWLAWSAAALSAFGTIVLIARAYRISRRK
ncbi:MAG: hypothetical protein ACOYD0_10375 [Candidatus Nanopelagicales bacterium]